MNRGINLIYIILFISMLPFGSVSSQVQEDQPLIKDVIKKSRKAGEAEWLNDIKTSYSYDIKDRVTLEQLSFWDPEKSDWKIKEEEYSEFDNDDNLIKYHDVNYLSFPHIQNEVLDIRQYENGLIKHRSISETDYLNAVSGKRHYEQFYEHNENGYRTAYQTLTNINDVFVGGNGYRRYYNENNCRIAMVNFEIDPSHHEVLIDSTTLTRDDHCNITYRARYENYFGNYYLSSEQQYEFDYDQNNNVTREKEYRRNSNDEWQVITDNQYTYNQSGQITSSYANDIFNSVEYIQNSFYDENDRIIRQTSEYRGNPEDDWIIVNFLQYTYSSLDQLVKTEFYFNWNEAIGDFEGYTVRDETFDTNGYNIQTITNQNLLGDITNFEQNREFRCDGAVMSESNILIRTNDAFSVQSEDSYSTTYFSRAFCEESLDSKPQFVIFPNPASDYFHIHSDSHFGDSEIRVINANGEIVMDRNEFINNYFSMDVNALKPGLYVVQIQNGSGSTSQKFVKE